MPQESERKIIVRMLLSIYRRSVYAERKASILSLSLSLGVPNTMWCWLEGESIAQKMMIRCCSAFSLFTILFFSLPLFSLSSRGICASSSIYRARGRLRRRKTRQVIDRFLFSLLSFVCSVTHSKQVFTKREKRIACSTCLSVSISLLFVQNCTMRSILGQSSTKTNHGFFFSLSSYRDREFLFSPFLIHRVEEQNAQEDDDDGDAEEWQREPVTHRFVWWIFYSAA